ncbi:hypothetical protein T492DRAFT_888056 [Pavlovales sp. CCMP2436]|nr:hypothetical protein T492DRAFT_888056 [Pavlovales sp. CCMP2436]
MERRLTPPLSPLPTRSRLNAEKATVYRRFSTKKGRHEHLLELERRFMQLEQDEAHFAERQRKRAEFMRYSEVNGQCPCSASMLVGSLHKVIHDSQPGSGIVGIARLSNTQRISPFPYQAMYLDPIMALLDNDENDVSVQSLPDRTLRSFCCESPEIIADFFKYGQTPRHESRMMEGAAKVVKDGFICVCLRFELYFTVNMQFGRLNSQSVVFTQRCAKVSNRAFAECYLRTLLMAFLLADKHADETLLDICCELVSAGELVPLAIKTKVDTSRPRTQASIKAQMRIARAAAAAARLARRTFLAPLDEGPDSPAARTVSKTLIGTPVPARSPAAPAQARSTPAPARSLGPHEVSTPAPRSLGSGVSPASIAPTTRAARAASSPRAKEVAQLRDELAAALEREHRQAVERSHGQFDRSKCAKLERECACADVTELVLAIALGNADAQTAIAQSTLEKSRVSANFGAMLRRAEAAEAVEREEKVARRAAEERAEVAEAAECTARREAEEQAGVAETAASELNVLRLEFGQVTRVHSVTRRELGRMKSANAAMKRKRASETDGVTQLAAQLKEAETMAADDALSARRDALCAGKLLREAQAAAAAAAADRCGLEGARGEQRTDDDAARRLAGRQAARRAKAISKPHAVRHRLTLGRAKLTAAWDASCEVVRADVFAEFLASVARAATAHALKSIRADIFSADRCSCFISILPAGEGEPALHFPLLPDSIAIKEHGEGRREADGEAVSSHDNGRTATMSYVAGCHRVHVAFRAAGVCAAAPGTHTICYSCDAGTVASRSRSSNTWTCGGVRCADRSDGNCSLEGYALLVETASSDKFYALCDSMASILPAMAFYARDEQLPCCKRMLAAARAACRCTTSESFATPACEPASCLALMCARPCACARPSILPCKLVVTGDLANLHAMMGLGSVRTDTAHNSTHVTFDEGASLPIAPTPTPCATPTLQYRRELPGCGYVPRSAADVVAERQKRIAMPSGQARSEMLRTHKNHLFAPLIPYLEFNHYLGVMHFGHSIWDQFLAAVFKDVDALHGDEANLIKYDVIENLRNMGTGILPPISPRARATE